jgi:hypothetical protein
MLSKMKLCPELSTACLLKQGKGERRDWSGRVCLSSLSGRSLSAPKGKNPNIFTTLRGSPTRNLYSVPVLPDSSFGDQRTLVISKIMARTSRMIQYKDGTVFLITLFLYANPVDKDRIRINLKICWEILRESWGQLHLVTWPPDTQQEYGGGGGRGAEQLLQTRTKGEEWRKVLQGPFLNEFTRQK